mmetsp:Transcript_15517/g.41012  ORF Transcript_15517/g.41012 Transcript_15517/m.41012 type:complete len:279 (-) Transcript_15517:596-1432(-)
MTSAAAASACSSRRSFSSAAFTLAAISSFLDTLLINAGAAFMLTTVTVTPDTSQGPNVAESTRSCLNASTFVAIALTAPASKTVTLTSTFTLPAVTASMATSLGVTDNLAATLALKLTWSKRSIVMSARTTLNPTTCTDFGSDGVAAAAAVSMGPMNESGTAPVRPSLVSTTLVHPSPCTDVTSAASPARAEICHASVGSASKSKRIEWVGVGGAGGRGGIGGDAAVGVASMYDDGIEPRLPLAVITSAQPSPWSSTSDTRSPSPTEICHDFESGSAS